MSSKKNHLVYSACFPWDLKQWKLWKGLLLVGFFQFCNVKVNFYVLFPRQKWWSKSLLLNKSAYSYFYYMTPGAEFFYKTIRYVWKSSVLGALRPLSRSSVLHSLRTECIGTGQVAAVWHAEQHGFLKAPATSAYNYILKFVFCCT